MFINIMLKVNEFMDRIAFTSASQRLSVRVRLAAGRKPKWYQP